MCQIGRWENWMKSLGRFNFVEGFAVLCLRRLTLALFEWLRRFYVSRYAVSKFLWANARLNGYAVSETQ